MNNCIIVWVIFLLKGGDLVPIVLFFIPLLLVVISLGIYFINKSIISAKNLFYCYCILLMVVEVIVFIFMSDVQFIPPSLSFSWFQGTFIFIVVSLIYIFCKIPFKEKLRYIWYSFSFNYLLLPLLFIWVVWITALNYWDSNRMSKWTSYYVMLISTLF